jgi:hypothetical protein
MATRSTAGVGLAHVTVVPANVDPDADRLSRDAERSTEDPTQ